MPAAQTKSDLAAVTLKEFTKLQALLSGIDPAAAMVKRDDISIKDIVAHRAHWIDLFLGWYAEGQAGREVHFPAKGYKWNDLPRYNAALRARQRTLDWPAALAQLHAAHDALTHFIDAHSDHALYAGPMPGARNHWTTGRWAEAAGASHFRSAAKYVRSCIRNPD